MLFLLFQWFAFPLGLVLVLVGVFMTKPQEKELVENRIWRWWYRVTAAHETIEGKLIAATQALARGTLGTLDWLFGKRPISGQAIWFSIGLTWSAIALYTAVRQSKSREALYLSSLGSMAFSVIPSLINTYVKPRFPKTAKLLAWGIGVVVAGEMFLVACITDEVWYAMGDFLWLAVGSLVSDIVLLALLRLVLRKFIADGQSGLVYLATIVTVPVAIIGIHQSLPLAFDVLFSVPRYYPLIKVIAVVSVWMYWFVVMNALYMIVSLALMASMLLIAINMLFWETLQRSFERLTESFPSRAVVVSVGAFLLSSAYWHSFGQAAHSLAKKIGVEDESAEQGAAKKVQP